MAQTTNGLHKSVHQLQVRDQFLSTPTFLHIVDAICVVVLYKTSMHQPQLRNQRLNVVMVLHIVGVRSIIVLMLCGATLDKSTVVNTLTSSFHSKTLLIQQPFFTHFARSYHSKFWHERKLKEMACHEESHPSL